MIQKTKQNEKKSIIEYSQKTLALLEIMDWEIPSKIYLFLRTHGELSLKQLAISIGKSKTTISRHLTPMLERKLVSEREFKKAHLYKLDQGLLNLGTPITEFTRGYPEKKKLFGELLDLMDPEELLLVNESFDAIYKIVLKILQNTLDHAIEYVELYDQMPVNKQRLLDYEEYMDFIITFTSLNRANIDIFNKHWKVFMTNFKKDIDANFLENDENSEPFPNFNPVAADSLAWLFKLPMNRIFKLK